MITSFLYSQQIAVLATNVKAELGKVHYNLYRKAALSIFISYS